MPAALVASCVERAEGNPLFLLQLLLDAGAAAQTSLPGSIQALVHTRMDRLAGEDKAALQAAAVLGQRFAIEALRHLLDRAGLRRRAPGRELPRPRRRRRVHVLPCADPRRRLRIAAAQAPPRPARAAPPSGSRAARPACSPPSTSTAPRIRAPRAAYLAASDALAEQFRHAAALALVERGLALAVAHEIALRPADGARPAAASSSAVPARRSRRRAPRSRPSANAGERAHALIADAPPACASTTASPKASPRSTRPSRWPADAALALELSRLHHLRGNLLFPLGRDADCLREHELARQHAARSRLARGRGGGARRARRRLLPAGAHALGERAVPAPAWRWRVQHGFGRLEVANLSDGRLDGNAPDRDRRPPSPSARKPSRWRSGRRSRAPS